jgi:hypothetical protein
MVPFGIELGASSHPASGPAAERPYVRRLPKGDGVPGKVAHDGQQADTDAPWAWILALTALGYGLFLWVISTFTFAYYRFPELREFWSTPHSFGLTNLQIAAFVNVLFCALAIFSAAVQWRTRRPRPWSLIITYGTGLAIGMAWLVNLYGLASILSDGSAFDRSVMDETYDIYRVHLGQVVGSEPCPHCADGDVILEVQLETNLDVSVAAYADQNPVGSIVAIKELRGRFSGSSRYEHYSDVHADDPILFMKRHFVRPSE